jgi:hypothetical protein
VPSLASGSLNVMHMLDPAFLDLWRSIGRYRQPL